MNSIKIQNLESQALDLLRDVMEEPFADGEYCGRKAEIARMYSETALNLRKMRLMREAGNE